MCGRYVSPSQADIERFWHIGRRDHPLADAFPARYNVAPQQGNAANYIPVIRHSAAAEPALTRMQWWLLPHWAKESRVKYSTFNARIETVATAAAFRVPLRRRRCLIPALGWYEWQALPAGKQPWYMHAPAGGLLHFAGLWDRWTRGDESIESCAIIVRPASGAPAAVHDRMPAIVAPEQHAAWLDPGLHDADQVSALLQPSEAQALIVHKVSTRVSNARNQGPELIDPS